MTPRHCHVYSQVTQITKGVLDPTVSSVALVVQIACSVCQTQMVVSVPGHHAVTIHRLLQEFIATYPAFTQELLPAQPDGEGDGVPN